MIHVHDFSEAADALSALPRHATDRQAWNVQLHIENPVVTTIRSHFERFPGAKKYLDSRAAWSGYLNKVQNDLNVHLYRRPGTGDNLKATIVIDRVGSQTVHGLLIVLNELILRMQIEFGAKVESVRLFIVEVGDSYTYDIDEYR